MDSTAEPRTATERAAESHHRATQQASVSHFRSTPEPPQSNGRSNGRQTRGGGQRQSIRADEDEDNGKGLYIIIYICNF